MEERSDRGRLLLTAIHIGILLFAAIYWSAYTEISDPFIYHADEPDVLGRSVRMAITGDLNPHWFHYPTLMIYVYAALVKLIQVTLAIPIELAVFLPFQGANPDAFPIYRMARLVTVGFSLGTLHLLVRLTSRFTSPLVAFLAALAFVGSEVVRESAVYITLEMPMTFFALAALISMIKLVDSAEEGEAKQRYLWYAVLFGSIAGGCKYNGAAVLFVLPLAMWLAHMPPAKIARRLALAALASIAIFILTTPFSALDYKTFFDPRVGMLYDFVHYSSGHIGADTGVSFFKAMSDLFNRHSYLVPLALLSPLALRDSAMKKQLLLVIAIPVLFLGMVSVAKAYFPRHIVPSLPAVNCLIAVGIWAAIGMTLRHSTPMRTVYRVTAPLVVVFAIAIVSTFTTAYSSLRWIKQPDTRTLAYGWISENLPPGSRILCEAYCPQLYFTEKFKVDYIWTISKAPYDWIERSDDYVVVSQSQWRRYDGLFYDTYKELFARTPLREWKSQPGKIRGPTIRIYSVGKNSES